VRSFDARLIPVSNTFRRHVLASQVLHPDSEVPRIECTCRGADRLEVVYRSPRRLGDLAEGLVRGCVDHFGERVAIDRVDVPGASGQTRFTLTRA
jgi:hypothetical protein